MLKSDEHWKKEENIKCREFVEKNIKSTIQTLKQKIRKREENNRKKVKTDENLRKNYIVLYDIVLLVNSRKPSIAEKHKLEINK